MTSFIFHVLYWWNRWLFDFILRSVLHFYDFTCTCMYNFILLDRILSI
jgi:hypothetical protein